MHFTLCTSLYALHSMHFTLCASLYALHSMHFTLCASLYALRSMHFALCTSLYALHSIVVGSEGSAWKNPSRCFREKKRSNRTRIRLDAKPIPGSSISSKIEFRNEIPITNQIIMEIIYFRWQKIYFSISISHIVDMGGFAPKGRVVFSIYWDPIVHSGIASPSIRPAPVSRISRTSFVLLLPSGT